MDGEFLNALDDPARNPRHKLRGNTITTAEIAKLYFEDRLPIKKIADKVGISATSVGSRLIRAGFQLRPKGGGPKPKAPIEELVRLYFEEMLSTNEIGALLGCRCESVRVRLRKAGHTLRNNVAARDMRAWRMGDAERKLTFGGKNRMEMQAATRQKGATKRTKVPPNETRLLSLLTDKSVLEFTQQRAVGIYNMDFATGAVGIEVIGGGRKAASFASCAERIYFILKSGFHLIELLHREPIDPFQECAVDKIIAFIDRVKGLPPSIREYRMIGGSGQLLAVFQVNLDHNTVV